VRAGASRAATRVPRGKSPQDSHFRHLRQYLLKHTLKHPVDNREQFLAAMRSEHERRRREKEKLEPNKPCATWSMVHFDFHAAKRELAAARLRLPFPGITHTYCISAETLGLTVTPKRKSDGGKARGALLELPLACAQRPWGCDGRCATTSGPTTTTRTCRRSPEEKSSTRWHHPGRRRPASRAPSRPLSEGDGGARSFLRVV
jgi:hypothetical protein